MEDIFSLEAKMNAIKTVRARLQESYDLLAQGAATQAPAKSLVWLYTEMTFEAARHWAPPGVAGLCKMYNINFAQIAEEEYQNALLRYNLR